MADFIPGINVGNLLKQVGSYVGLAPQGDYDILDNVSVNGGARDASGYTNYAGFGGQGQLNPGYTVGPQGNAVRTTTGSTQYGPVQSDQDMGGQVQGTQTTATDPYARYGGQDAYNSIISGFDTQKQNIYGTSREAANNAAIGRNSSILDFVQGLKTGQRAIDERGVQNELGRVQGRNSILDMVGRGIRSGGTMLANKNASGSSATEALARAYGQIGQRQLSNVNNQYELENRNIGLAQEDFNTNRSTGLRKFDENKQQTINGIVMDARSRLAALDAAMLEADLPTRLDIEAEKESVKNEVLGILSQYDQQLASGAAGVNPTGVDDRRRTAAGLATAGVAAENPFNFTSQAPAQFQNTGPFASDLPIFTFPRRQEA